MPSPSYPPVGEPRTELAKVPLSPGEKHQLVTLAAERGRSVGEVVRIALYEREDLSAE